MSKVKTIVYIIFLILLISWFAPLSFGFASFILEALTEVLSVHEFSETLSLVFFLLAPYFFLIFSGLTLIFSGISLLRKKSILWSSLIFALAFLTTMLFAWKSDFYFYIT